MADAMRLDGFFPSSDKLHQIPYSIFTPRAVSPKGIVQIVHGMCEFSARYEWNGCVDSLVEGGYIVCQSDHLGHGRAVTDASEYGDFQSASYLIEDLRALRQLLRQKYRYLPYFMLGHSMGSFLVREYINLYPDELNGVILSGTCAGKSPAGAARLVAKAFCAFGMGRKKGTFIKRIMDRTLAKQVGGKEASAWIVSDPSLIANAVGREDYGFPFTFRAYASLFGLMKHITDEEVLSAMPRSVPILLVSGSHDPVGGMEAGIRALYDKLFDIGIDDLRMKIYPGARHEILNEACREEVHADMLAFLEEECENYRNARILNRF